LLKLSSNVDECKPLTTGFAIAWNTFTAFWTASALAAGGGLVMAAFSIPFWFAGTTVAKAAFDEVFEASRLELDAFEFSLTTTVGWCRLTLSNPC